GLGEAGYEAAVARIRCSEAARLGAAIAHQVHGAIGVTDEHMLHHFTRRLWLWRLEFGAEAWWAEELGARVLAAGGDELWPLLTRDDPA
uniref:acyl-CoA dehydrogenase family protein n=1 Tax=Enterobacter hormaechei TaxID=158836 RepID=UPI0019532B43